MEDDNSCLFRAIGYVLERSIDIQILRNTIIKYIKDDPETYSDVVLGKSRDDYCSWIAEKNSWGGAIELAIFASYYKVEIRSVDVKSGRIDRYGHGIYDKCVYVIYSGIHYDAVALTPMIGADQEYDQTVFDTTDESILSAVIGIADKMKQLRKYTYTADFTIRCGQCQKGLKGEQEAVQHARETGHTSFTEYDG